MWYVLYVWRESGLGFLRMREWMMVCVPVAFLEGLGDPADAFITQWSSAEGGTVVGFRLECATPERIENNKK